MLILPGDYLNQNYKNLLYYTKLKFWLKKPEVQEKMLQK